MNTVLLIVHLFVTLLLIGVVLIQRSEGGGLGIGSSQGMGSFMSGRGTANLLTRATAILAVIFFALSMTLAALNHGSSRTSSLLDSLPAGPTGAPAAPTTPAPAASTPATPAPATPATPAPGTPAPATPAPAAKAPATPAPASTPAAPSAPTN